MIKTESLIHSLVKHNGMVNFKNCHCMIDILNKLSTDCMNLDF